MGLLTMFFNQTRRPEGRLGKMMLSTMNSGHAKLADWGMSHLPEFMPEEILELGCGAGRNAGELLKRYPSVHVTAIDHSPLSVQKTKEYNRSAIAAGRCAVQQGDVSGLELPAGRYDLATAFETVYFWPGLAACFLQVRERLKPNGCFLICNESDGRDATGKIFEGIIDGMKCYTAEEIEAALKTAGFSNVMIDHHERKPWVSILAWNADHKYGTDRE